MINSKSKLLKRLRGDNSKIKFKTIENHCKEGFQVGIVRECGSIIQTNAFTIKTRKDDGEIVNSWCYFSDINIKNNIIEYKNAPIKIEIIEVA